MKTIIYFFIFLAALNPCAAQANGFILDELAYLQQPDNSAATPPIPNNLHPMWWHYFDAEDEELQKRIDLTIQNLHALYLTLNQEDQALASPLINKISSSLHVLPQVQKQESTPTVLSQPFLSSYTLDHQIELNQNIRILKVDIKNEEDRFMHLKMRLTKVQQHVDNMMVAYVDLPASSPKKIISGLEMMTFGIHIEIGHLKERLASQRLEALKSRLAGLEEELNFSKQHMDASNFDEALLEKNIAFYNKELDQKQNELAKAEANLLAAFSQQNYDFENQLVLEQQVMKALVAKAYAWAKLSFHTLKYNLLMHQNERFDTGQHAIQENLNAWRDKIKTTAQQVQEWKKSALKDEDRVRQDYAFLIGQTEPSDSKKLRVNKTMRKGTAQTLTTLDLLEDELSHTELLVDLLEVNVRKYNNFLQNGWLTLSGVFSKARASVDYVLHYSLFKVSGIPVTPLTIMKIIIILAISFWLSRFVRSSLISFGKHRGDITESTLYSLGSLAHYAILLLGIVIALCSIGLEFGNLVFVIGALTFGISFGLQSLANNFFCGLRILFERKLNIGDSVKLHSGQEGKVVEIHVQNTVVRTNDGQKIIVPNSELIGNTLVKWAKHQYDYRRLHIPFAVAEGCDKELVRRVVIEAAKRVPCALKDNLKYHEPQVWLINFSHHALEFELVVWIDYEAPGVTDSKEADFLWEIEDAFRKHNIPLPEHPLKDLFLASSH